MRKYLQGALSFMLLLLVFAHSGAAAQDTGGHDTPSDGPRRISEVVFDIRDYPGETGQIISLARDLTDLHPGGIFTDEILDKAVSVLKFSGRFESVEVEAVPGPDGVGVILRLKPYLVIREIDIRGQHPLFRRDIVRAMTAYVGDYLVPGLPQEQARLIREYILTEGFIDPRVSIRVIQSDEDASVKLEVEIDKGAYYALDSLRIRGNRNFTDAWIKTRLGIWWDSLYPGTAGRFQESRLEEDVRGLASYYWRRGYAEADTAYTVRKNPRTGEVDVIVAVTEGPRYDISITGNDEFWTRTIRNRIVISHEGNARGTGLRRSIRNIRNLYRENGYPDVQVTAEEEVRGSGANEERLVTIVIHEGRQATVESVRFQGNHSFDDERLLDQIETGDRRIPLIGKRLFVDDVLQQDVRALQSFYQQEGFGMVRVRSEVLQDDESSGVTVVLTIEEGPRTIVSSVGFEGLNVISENQARSAVMTVPGDPLRPYVLQRDERTLAAMISEQGYPHVRVEGSVVYNRERTLAAVSFAVNEGLLVRMGRTYFSGNFRTKKRILDREFQMDPGDPFSLQEMIQGQNEIRRMGIFQTIRYRTLGLREMRDDVILLANLEEREPYYVQASLGYENNLGLYGSARVGDRNVLGLNRELWADAEVSQTGERYELGLRSPRVFGTRITSIYNLFYERKEPFNQEFEVETFGSTLGFVSPISDVSFASLNFRYEQRDLSDDDIVFENLEEMDEDRLDPRNVLVVTPSITYDTRDSFTRPTRGWFATFFVDISNGLQDDLDDFLRYSLIASAYVTPLENVTLAFSGRAGYITSYGGSDFVPEDQLFYLGGTLDVRGFDENRLLLDADGDPVGGRMSLATQTEIRYAMGYNLELALFFDTGTIRRTFVEPVTDNTRFSYGAGLRYITPIGPVGLLYGRKIDPEPGEDPYRWHFSIGYAF